MKKRLFTIPSVFVLLVASVMPAVAQERPKENPYVDRLIFWGYPESYLENQAKMGFLQINEVLQANKPSLRENMNRDMALLGLDMLLHDRKNDNSEAFHQFINSRMQAMLQDMDKPVKKGMKIYKSYNDGFIVKTKKATIAIDLVPGGPKNNPFITDSIIYAIADRCDAMFITHAHGDHANLDIAKAFAAKGKLVIVPKGLWTGVDPQIQQLLDADTVVSVPFDKLGMNLQILPGHQDDMYNNIYVMNFKGAGTVAHTGDQYNGDDLLWIDSIHKNYKIDVLLLNCWINSINRTIKGFGPKLVITGHENELEHSIDHRESYWMTRMKWKNFGISTPNILMTWGEWYNF